MLIIDGSTGEGGGQIVRTSLALSLITGTPVRLEKIRAGRAKPGLLRQHLTAVRAAVSIGASVRGAELGAETLEIEPGSVCGGHHHFAVGSAGSACLVFQTVLPALIAAREKATIVLEGGTHNPFAPTFDYLDRVFLPVLRRMGLQCEAQLERRGFYPAGGGRCSFTVDASSGLSPLDIVDRGNVLGSRATAVVANLPYSIAERELAVVKRRLDLEDASLEAVAEKSSPGPGNVLMLEIECQHATEMCTGFGERNVRAETVANRAVGELRRYLEASAPVGIRLADQLMLPFLIAGGGSFRTVPLSQHSRTNLWVIEQFAPGSIRCDEEDEEVTLSCERSGRSGEPH